MRDKAFDVLDEEHRSPMSAVADVSPINKGSHT